MRQRGEQANEKAVTRKQLMAEAAKAGSVDGVLDILENSPFPDFGGEIADAMECVGEALKALGEDEPAFLAEALFTRMLAFQGKLLHRVQHFIDRELAKLDRQCVGQPMSPAIADEWLPRLARIQASIVDTTKAMATVQHTFALSYGGAIQPKRHRTKAGCVVPFPPSHEKGLNARSG